MANIYCLTVDNTFKVVDLHGKAGPDLAKTGGSSHGVTVYGGAWSRWLMVSRLLLCPIFLTRDQRGLDLKNLTSTYLRAYLR